MGIAEASPMSIVSLIINHAPVHEDPGADELSAHREALEHTEDDEEDRGGPPDLGVGGEAALCCVIFVVESIIRGI
jgi:hypothetical protein